MANESHSENHGIGEWYGRAFTALTVDERRRFANIQRLKPSERPDMPCPFQSHSDKVVSCSKAGGVCSLRRYCLTDHGVEPADDLSCGLCATCPSRFEEDDLIYRWIGTELLCTPEPAVLGEIDFLEDPQGNKVGRIDSILVHPGLDNRLEWCALEKQAVYFSGAAMTNEFNMLLEQEVEGIPYPVGRRRPDFRSSGPKRLMPQLQIKVPTLRRWGKKMAVVVDEPFFSSMGEMETVDDISNGDIIWFVVGYEEDGGGITLVPRMLHVTTLETSVVGLTGGEPVSKSDFEAEILRKLSR